MMVQHCVTCLRVDTTCIQIRLPQDLMCQHCEVFNSSCGGKAKNKRKKYKQPWSHHNQKSHYKY